ncbi:aminotransferase class III-fold pyridoxal phosphate-dependent enzyme [Haloferax sp. MBLA0076]|uniref:Aminotransferase class III-fold pyridoxal phosphate-dependent enzyme n=1 Tax=Haloferax litoreum TaxID=2666140 RepID=A0A6A8GJT7_9EURY|nr:MULTISPECIES: aspartate aminotransferase family protein [Haloferax]KAB1190553.1 aspartate aminotransferase family protein [Haloferax sp. CBA1148]MRX23538.1 aminotransferase class III-fold pyridoxal phosphate-dependent enzyme [Haloferax litoreum]
MAQHNHIFYKWGGGIEPDLPRVDHAHDEFLVTEDGEKLIDAAAGAAVTNLGHSVPGIEEIFESQSAEVSYLSLSHFSHDAPEDLARTLATRAPGDLSKVFFTNSGSEANEAAFKLAREYFRARGKPEKSVVVSRWQSYHGATFGALSATGNTLRRRGFEPFLTDWEHISPAYPYRWSFDGTPEEQARAAARELETTIRQRGPDTVAAFVAEPVGGASIPAAAPHPVYYKEIRDICDEYDVLFIADEVMTGFGRTGPLFAMEHYGVTPDMMSLGKGLTSGYTPMSAVLVNDKVADEFAREDVSFAHGHTFAGNPLSAAVANFVVEQYTDGVLERGQQRGQQLASELAPLADHPMVGDFRAIGPMVGLEFVADKDTKEPFDPSQKVYKQVYDAALDRGVYTYPGKGSVDGVAGDHLMLSPPLTLSESSVSRIAEAVEGAIEDVYSRVHPGVTA